MTKWRITKLAIIIPFFRKITRTNKTFVDPAGVPKIKEKKTTSKKKHQNNIYTLYIYT
jgi:hypothetical protein